MVEVGFLVFETDQTSGEPHATQWKICPEKINKLNQPKKITKADEINSRGYLRMNATQNNFKMVPNVYLVVKPS